MRANEVGKVTGKARAYSLGSPGLADKISLRPGVPSGRHEEGRHDDCPAREGRVGQKLGEEGMVEGVGLTLHGGGADDAHLGGKDYGKF